MASKKQRGGGAARSLVATILTRAGRRERAQAAAARSVADPFRASRPQKQAANLRRVATLSSERVQLLEAGEAAVRSGRTQQKQAAPGSGRAAKAQTGAGETTGGAEASRARQKQTNPGRLTVFLLAVAAAFAWICATGVYAQSESGGKPGAAASATTAAALKKAPKPSSLQNLQNKSEKEASNKTESGGGRTAAQDEGRGGSGAQTSSRGGSHAQTGGGAKATSAAAAGGREPAAQKAGAEQKSADKKATEGGASLTSPPPPGAKPEAGGGAAQGDRTKTSAGPQSKPRPAPAQIPAANQAQQQPAEANSASPKQAEQDFGPAGSNDPASTPASAEPLTGPPEAKETAPPDLSPETAEEFSEEKNEELNAGLLKLKSFMEPFLYDPSIKRRDPFFDPTREEEAEDDKQDQIILTKPDAKKSAKDKIAPAPPEKYALKSIELKGIIWDIKSPRALFKLPQADGFYTLFEGDRIGLHGGVIEDIAEDRVQIKETIIKGDGVDQQKEVKSTIKKLNRLFK